MGKKLIGKKSAAVIAGAINRLADSFFALAQSLQGAYVPGSESGVRNPPPGDGEPVDSKTGSFTGSADAIPENTSRTRFPETSPAAPDIPAPVSAPVPLPTPDASETRCGEALQKFMKDNVFLITRIDNIINESPVWNQMARIIGSDYHAVLPIINALKISQSRGNRMVINLSRYDIRTRNACTNLASVLYRNALLVEYRYTSGVVPTLTMRVQKDGAIINFITGHWMEIYVYGIVREILSNYARLYSIEVETYSNIQFLMTQKETFELDVLSFVNGTPVWVECKTGEFQQSIVKYKKFGKRTSIAPEHSFLVLAGVSAEQARNITDIHRYNVINLDNFRTVFSQAMAGLCLAAGRKDSPESPEEKPGPVSEASDNAECGSTDSVSVTSGSAESGTAASDVSEPSSVPPRISSGMTAPISEGDVPAAGAASAGNELRQETGGRRTSPGAESRNRSSYDRMMALISSTRPVKSLDRPEQPKTLSEPVPTIAAALYTVVDHPFMNEAMSERMNTLGVQCVCNTPVSRTDISLDVLSRMKSGRYVLAPVLFKRIARALKTGDLSVVQSLNGCEPVQVGTTIQMCRHMADTMKVIRDFEYYSKEKTVRFDLIASSIFSQYVLEDTRFFHAVGNVIDTAFQNTDGNVFGISRNVRLCKGEVRIDLDYLVRFREIVTAVIAGPSDPEKASAALELVGKWLDIPARNLLIVHNLRKESPEYAILSKKTSVNVLSHDEFDRLARQLMKVPEFPDGAGADRITIPELQFTPEQLYAWFSRFGVNVTEAELISAALSALDGSASEFYRNEEIFQPLLKEVLRLHENHIPRQRFVLNVENLNGEKTSSVSNLCTNLYKTDLIRDFEYNKTARKFVIDLTDNPELHSFFSGGWLRYYAGSKTQKYLGQHVRNPKAVRFIRNVSLELPEGDEISLDVLICHGGVWTAIRTCTAQNCIAMAEYLATAGDLLEIPKERQILVFPSEAETLVAPAQVREAMRIIPVSGFVSVLEEILTETLVGASGPDFEELLARIAKENASAASSDDAQETREGASAAFPENSEQPEEELDRAAGDTDHQDSGAGDSDSEFMDEAVKDFPLPEVLREIITEVTEENSEKEEETAKEPNRETGQERHEPEKVKENGRTNAASLSEIPEGRIPETPVPESAPGIPEPPVISDRDRKTPVSDAAGTGKTGSGQSGMSPDASPSEPRQDPGIKEGPAPSSPVSDSIIASYYRMLMDEAGDQALRDDFLESHLMKPEECADFLDDENIRVMDVLTYNGKAQDTDRLSLGILADFCRNQEYATVFNMLLEGLSRELSSFALDMDFPEETLSRYQKLLNDMVEIALVYKNVFIRDSRESRITVLKPRALRDFITGGWFRNAGAAIVQNRLMDLSVRHPECFCLFARNADILLDNYRIAADLVIRTMNRVMLFVFATSNAEGAAGELAMLVEYMDIDPRDAVLVCLDSTPESLTRVSAGFPVTVIGFDALGEFLDSHITPEYLESEYLSDEESDDDGPDEQDAETVLHKFGYCPGLFDYMRYEF